MARRRSAKAERGTQRSPAEARSKLLEAGGLLLFALLTVALLGWQLWNNRALSLGWRVLEIALGVVVCGLLLLSAGIVYVRYQDWLALRADAKARR